MKISWACSKGNAKSIPLLPRYPLLLLAFFILDKLVVSCGVTATIAHAKK
jgi:hypothetical protein